MNSQEKGKCRNDRIMSAMTFLPLPPPKGDKLLPSSCPSPIGEGIDNASKIAMN
jgi:hypothetical protein